MINSMLNHVIMSRLCHGIKIAKSCFGVVYVSMCVNIAILVNKGYVQDCPTRRLYSIFISAQGPVGCSKVG